MFEKTQKVYFGHIDGAGIVYHPHFIDYFNQAYEDLLEELGVPGMDLQRDLGIRVPVVNIDVDFHKPMEAGERLTIQVRVDRIGNTSIQFDFRAVDQEGDSIVTGKVTRVTVDDDFEKTPVPDRIRELLEPHLTDGS